MPVLDHEGEDDVVWLRCFSLSCCRAEASAFVWWSWKVLTPKCHNSFFAKHGCTFFGNFLCLCIARRTACHRYHIHTFFFFNSCSDFGGCSKPSTQISSFNLCVECRWNRMQRVIKLRGSLALLVLDISSPLERKGSENPNLVQVQYITLWKLQRKLWWAQHR